MSKIIDLKTEHGRVERCSADMVDLQIKTGKSLTISERQIYALAWRDGCMAGIEHAKSELNGALSELARFEPKEQPLPDIIP